MLKIGMYRTHGTTVGLCGSVALVKVGDIELMEHRYHHTGIDDAKRYCRYPFMRVE